jgi:hypothetical protein
LVLDPLSLHNLSLCICLPHLSWQYSWRDHIFQVNEFFRFRNSSLEVNMNLKQ